MLPMLLATALLAVPLPARAPAPPAEIAEIPVSMLVDLGSGQILHARETDRRFPPASMAKVMTVYVAFEEISAGRLSLDRRFTVKPETSREWKGKGTSMYLEPNESVSVDHLLRGIMTASANDASVVLAEGYAGSIDAWTSLMNDAAKRIGLTRSRFNTSNGWPDGGKTRVTAHDLVMLAEAMLTRYPKLYRRYAGQKRFVWNGRTLTSYDPVTGVVPGADGIKSGHTREAGYNFLGSAERDGRRLVMVVAGAKSMEERARASRAMLEWGFADWKARPLYRAGEIVSTARVQGGESRIVGLVAARNIHAVVPQGGSPRLSLKLVYRGPIKAPIARGAQVAELEITVDGMKPGRVPLRAAQTIRKAGPMDRLWNGLMNLAS